MKNQAEPKCPICGDRVWNTVPNGLCCARIGCDGYVSLSSPPLPAMPASVRELVDGIDLMISTFRHRDLMPPNMERDMRVRIAAVEAHYAGGA